MFPHKNTENLAERPALLCLSARKGLAFTDEDEAELVPMAGLLVAHLVAVGTTLLNHGFVVCSSAHRRMWVTRPPFRSRALLGRALHSSTVQVLSPLSTAQDQPPTPIHPSQEWFRTQRGQRLLCTPK